ncbi:MAG: hypothetical protein OXI63_09045, partial [Candidatus Poribacteria bacterium]|nr:hypothetical protein [Candidatus Poribacteria bacterium]
IAWFTSRDWGQDIRTTTGETARKLRRLSLITTCLIYMQLIFGAILRHTGSRLDAHLLFAFLVALHVFLLARRLLAVDSESDGIGQSMPLLLLGLLAVQLMLGTGAFFAKLTAFGETFAAALTVTITTAHVAVGALMLVISFVLTLKIYRFTDASVTIETAASGALVTE